MEHFATVVRRAIPQWSAKKARKEESQKGNETVTKGKVKDRIGERAFGKSTKKNLKEIGT